jgi:hypothetical protein
MYKTACKNPIAVITRGAGAICCPQHVQERIKLDIPFWLQFQQGLYNLKKSRHFVSWLQILWLQHT